MTLTWRALAADAERLLASAGIESAAAEARHIISHVAIRQYAVSHVVLAPAPSADDAEAIRMLTAERAKRRPLQHVLGSMFFRGLELTSAPGVFTVRPETELVAEAAIAEATHSGRAVIDLCTGSGAIALAVKAEVPSVHVVAVEVDPVAAAAARANAERLELDVEVIEADALTDAPWVERWRGAAGVVVSNPPYVPAWHRDVMAPEALADPDLALWGGGEDGMDIPARIIARGEELLAPGGLLVMEHASEQAGAVRAECERAGLVNVESQADLTGETRFVTARRPAGHS